MAGVLHAFSYGSNPERRVRWANSDGTTRNADIVRLIISRPF